MKTVSHNLFKSFHIHIFGKKMEALHKERKMTQDKLAKLLSTSISAIGSYECDEMTLSIEVATNISNHLHTTVGYLLEKTDEADIFNDPVMLQSPAGLDKLYTEKSHIVHVLNGTIKSVKLKNIAVL